MDFRLRGNDNKRHIKLFTTPAKGFKQYNDKRQKNDVYEIS